MNRAGSLIAVLLLAGACDQAPPAQAQLSPAKSPPGTPASAQLRQLLASKDKAIGYLQSADKPWAIASFGEGWFEWQWGPESGKGPAVAQGRSESFSAPDRRCIGLEQNSPTFAAHGVERFLLCEATELIEASNSLPRSQDFRFAPKTLFLEYQPPLGTGFTQYFYVARSKENP